jgi:hypothetical protein
MYERVQRGLESRPVAMGSARFAVVLNRFYEEILFGVALTQDVILQVIDQVLFHGEQRFDHVAHGHHANQPAAIHDRKVANVPLDHQVHTLFQAGTQVDRDHFSGH